MKCKPIDTMKPLYFGIHKFDKVDNCNVILQKDYPITKISKKYKSCFFTNTVSYMLAYALYTGIQEIDIYGVDMNGREDYENQRPSVMYWIGYLRANGVKINMTNDLDKPPFIYGYDYDKATSLRTKINAMIDNTNIEMTAELPEDKKNQFIGFKYALELIKKEL